MEKIKTPEHMESKPTHLLANPRNHIVVGRPLKNKIKIIDLTETNHLVIPFCDIAKHQKCKIGSNL
jgi:hypothetical protein